MANRGRGMQAEEYRMYFRGEEYCGWPGEPVFHASHAYASQLERTESGVVSSWSSAASTSAAGLGPRRLVRGQRLDLPLAEEPTRRVDLLGGQRVSLE